MKIRYFDRAIEILFLAMMLVLPIIFDRRIGIVFSGTKSATMRLFILAILFIWAVKLLVGGKQVFRRTPLDWPVLSFILATSAATITSVHFLVSFFGFYGRYEGLITWLCYALMFFIFVNYMRGFEKVKQFAALIAPVATAMAAYGIIQRQGIDPYVWGGVVTWQRVIATIGQPNFLSAYLIMAFFVLLYFMLSDMPGSAPSPEPVKEKERSKKKAPQKTGAFSYDWVNDVVLPVSYYLMVPFLFILMIFSQTGQNVLVWYLFFAAMAASGLLFVYTYHRLPDAVMKLLIGASLVVIYTGNFYTQSRGGYLGLAVGAVLVLLLTPRKRILKEWKPLGALFAAIFIVTAVTAMNPEFSPFARFMGEVKIGPESSRNVELKKGPHGRGTPVELEGAAGSRGETWKSAFGIIADNPVFGIGPETLKMIFPRYETELFRFKEAFHVKQDRCHNETFDVPVTKGLIAFFVYIWIIFIIFSHGIKTLKRVDDDRKVMIAAVLASIASYLVQNQFSFGVIAITSIFWCLWGMVMNMDSEPIKESDKEVSLEDVPWVTAGLLLILVLAAGHFSLLQFRADRHFKTGKNYMDHRRFRESVDHYINSLSIFPIEGGTITHKGIALLNASLAAPPQQQFNIQNESLKTFAYGMEVDPYNADNFYITSRIYLMRGDIVSAESFASKALKIDPYYAEVYINLASIRERQGRMEEAKAFYREAHRINPNLSEPKLKVAWEHLHENELDEAFRLFQDLLTSDSRNPQVHSGLGMVYHRRGERARAREQFEHTLRLDPNNPLAKSMLNR